MKQKVVLAGALIHDPKLLILDEPLTGLDAAAARQVKDVLTERVKGGATVIHFDRGFAPSCLTDGWAVPEAGLGIWSQGHVSRIGLRNLPTGRPVELVFTLQPFVARGRPSQRVRISAGGRQVADLTLAGQGFRAIKVSIPAESQSAGAAELSFDLPDADVPARLTPGSQDARTLGVMLKSIEIPA
jgi:hypothetical protein